MNLPDDSRTDGNLWLDAEAGPVVRPYTVTGGRAHPVGGEFDLVSFVVATPGNGRANGHLLPEHRTILANTAVPIPVAELAARLDLALGVVRVLLGDLARDGLIEVQNPDAGGTEPDDRTLEAVIDGLRAL